MTAVCFVLFQVPAVLFGMVALLATMLAIDFTVVAAVVLIVIFFIGVTIFPSIASAIAPVIASDVPSAVASCIGYYSEGQHLLRGLKHRCEGHFHHGLVILDHCHLTLLHLVELILMLHLHEGEHH